MTGRKQGHNEVGSHGRGQYIEAVMPALPTQCAVCRGWSARRLCNDCRARHAASVPRCTACAIQVPAGVDRCGACLTAPLPFGTTVAAVDDYQFPWSALVTAFKFHAALDLATPMAALLALAPGAATALRGHSVALVDGVMTTGATTAEAARTLLAAGMVSVQLWVFARTPAP
jgi:predicted amidophosphoribosyltransferase